MSQKFTVDVRFSRHFGTLESLSFWGEGEGLILLEQIAHIAIGIGKIAKVPRLSWTGDNTCRLHPLIHAIHAEVTFDNRALGPALVFDLFVNTQTVLKIPFIQKTWLYVVAMIIRARKRTAATADTDIAIYRDDTIISLEACPRWADFNTRRLFAVIT